MEAIDASSIKSLTGGAALSVGGNAAVGIALSANFIANTVTAKVDGSTLNNQANDSTGSVIVHADETGSIDSLAIGLGLGGKVSVAGSVTVNVIVDTVEAAVIGASAVKTAGNMRTYARNMAHAGTVAGQVAIGGTAGVGAAITNVDIINRTKAWIGGSATIDADARVPSFKDTSGRQVKGVSVEADSPKDVVIIAVGAAGGGTAGIAGSFSVTVIDDVTEAYIADRTSSATAGSIDSAADINVVAKGNFAVIGTAGALAIGGTAGVGLGADVGVVTTKTHAYVGDRANLVADQLEEVVALQAEFDITIEEAAPTWESLLGKLQQIVAQHAASD